jgi:cytoskeleton protein RodZ
VTEPNVNANAGSGAPLNPASAGALLRSAREAGGLTVDAVAQQLKLAPRQVRAIEEGDFIHLPGRTFVRGFIRNYARLVRLDAESVLRALPAGSATPNLESPALHATAPTIGELPTTEPPKHGWTRWAIPLTLIAIIAATAAWEFLHPDAPRASAKKDAPPGVERGKAGAPEIIGTPLPNPVASTEPVSVPAATSEPPRIANSVSAVDPPKAAPEAVADTRVAEAANASAVDDAPLVLAFRDFSWTEVKDRNGRVLLKRMNGGGTAQTISGAPPLDVVIGNAADVMLTWKGRRLDLAPYTRGNVARFILE